MICSYFQDVPESNIVLCVFGEDVPFVIENMTLNDAGATWNQV